MRGIRRFLNKNVLEGEVFFCFLTNSVFLKIQHTWLVRSVPNRTFLLFFFNNMLVLKFFDKCSSFWGFFWDFLRLTNSIKFGFFGELSLVGLGFRIKRILNNVYRFWWGRSNYTYLFVPADLSVQYSYHERAIFFFSYSSAILNDFLSFFLILRKLSRYRIHGFVVPNKIIRLHTGKQR